MKSNCGSAFESIESAQEFVSLLAEAVIEAKHDVSADIEREVPSPVTRRLQALQVTLYSLEKLEVHMKASRRILNDLRSLRRLLCEERALAGARKLEIKTQKIQAAPVLAASPSGLKPAVVAKAAAA